MSGAVTRPGVDVVVPFVGSAENLAGLLRQLEHLPIGAGDTLTIADNRRGAPPAPADPPNGVRLLRAPDRPSSYHARNRGAAGGAGEWILFIDADVEPPADLLDRYFGEPPGERTAVLAGAVDDEEVHAGRRPALAARYAMLQGAMSQRNTLSKGCWGYAQTANCAVRRSAFEAVGGFREDVRSGGDADLCFRLREAGWELEPRDAAAVVHHARRTLRDLLRQRARHGSGAAWLEREHPGSFPPKRWPGLIKWTLESEAGAATALARGHRDDAVLGAVDPLCVLAFELGRRVSNSVPAARA